MQSNGDREELLWSRTAGSRSVSPNYAVSERMTSWRCRWCSSSKNVEMKTGRACFRASFLQARLPIQPDRDALRLSRFALRNECQKLLTVGRRLIAEFAKPSRR